MVPSTAAGYPICGTCGIRTDPDPTIMMSECHFVPREPGAPLREASVSKTKRRFSLRKKRASVPKEPSSAAGMATGIEGGGDPLAWHERLETPPKRKETFTAGMRRRSIRLVTLPFRHPTGHRAKGTPSQLEEPPESPSVFERECQHNLSPNDPEFVRRTSMRWRRKTAVIVRPQGVPSQGDPGRRCLLKVPTMAPHHTKFEWPTHPSQQSSFCRRVSSPQAPYGLAVTLVPPTVPPSSLPPQRRPFAQPPRAQRRFSSGGLPQRALEQTPKKKTRRMSLQPCQTKRRSCADDRVVEALRKFLKVDRRRKESCKHEKRREKENDFVPTPTPLRRFSVRLRKSFRVHKRDDDLSSDSGLSSGSDVSSLSSRSYHDSLSSRVSSSSSYQSNLSSRSDLSFRSNFSASSVSSSSSYHSGFSSTSSSSTSPPVFSSSTSCHSEISMLSSLSYRSSSSTSSSLTLSSSSSSSPRLGFHEIFVAEPEIAKEIAIMFPTEPRPEWHRHLRQVLHKAGQKIFKKPEPHDTHIPENLRYQLKQIYVY